MSAQKTQSSCRLSNPRLDADRFSGFLAPAMRGNQAVYAQQTRKAKTALICLIALAALTARAAAK